MTVSFLSDDALRNLRTIAELPDLPADRYRLLDKLGEGGMGAVYRVEDLLLQREVAVKVLSLPRLSETERERMLTEARILAQLEHPGIVPVHDAGVLSDGRVFYTMKLVRGTRLDAYVSRGVTDQGSPKREPTPLAERIRLFVRICEAVAFAHAQGVIHRDLKPANVMVGAFGEVLVLDWGLAKLRFGPGASGPDSGSDFAGVVIGTPGFMAPEQERGDTENVDERTDIFALGAILRALVDEDGPHRLVAISNKATAHDPSYRYAKVPDLITELERYQEGLTISAYRDSVWERMVRFATRYRVFILLVLAYLAMRIALLLYQKRG